MRVKESRISPSNPRVSLLLSVRPEAIGSFGDLVAKHRDKWLNSHLD
jgi:hypothetical protein